MDIIKDYKRRALRNWIIIGALVVLTACCFVWANMVGSFNYSAETVVKAIFTPDAVDNQIHTVIWRLRLPMSVMALLVGVALAMAGAQMQTILDNPLAEPFTLGISAAAAFGGAASIVLGWTVIPQAQFNLAFIAWICAVLASLIIAGVATVRGGSNQTMILLGIALVFLFQAMLALMQYMATVEALQQIVFWTMGSMTRATWIGNGILAAVVVLCIPFFVINGWKLTALRLGEARAEAMGINVPRLRITTMLVVSVLAATAVAFSGIIGFVGLVGPHIARLIVGEDQRYFLPASMAVGGLVMVAAHVGSQIVNPGIAIPIGIVTSLIGVPFFLAIILGRRRAL
ncbi:FecCD family ABC transporter permease [Corynebacterium kroppenstedtii]|uniref:Iron ABC transport system, permease protein n=1 Tax=Corynebacterium kroppenstedtii (strain DSM 44385 / JCM 11950 / CIP 105744 / CCUG 35717) TaxID=645127 RepID=C4LL03_CORK4|nr:iron ABC transport system, permease protein [Corynebacterium kroppenstedtii DSM 44385]